jgi:hypothetical protein
MKYFYKLDENNVVTDITIAEDNFVSAGWIAADLNTKIAVGNTFDEGFFYPPSPYASWIKDGSGDWKPPIAIPSYNEETHFAYWNETNQEWIIVSKESEYHWQLRELDKMGWLDPHDLT